MTPALLLALHASPSEINLADRRDAAIVVLAPFGPSRASTSEIVQGAAEAFAAETDLRILSGQEAGIDVDRMIACPAAARLSCWTSIGAESRVGLLFIVTIILTPSGDRLAMSLLDLEIARTMLGRADAEEAIFERMIDLPVRDMTDVKAAFQTIVAEELRRYLTDRGHFRPFGEIAIETDCEGCSLRIGEEVVGVASRGTTRVVGLRPGPRQIALQRGELMLCDRRADVIAGGRVDLSCSEARFDPSPVFLWGGSIALALGAAGVIASLALSASGPDQVCLEEVPSKCDWVGAAGTSFRTSGPASPIEDADGGFPLLQTGGALAAAGSAWLAGSLLLDREWWWLTLAVGAALGSVAGGLLVLAD